MKLRALIVCVFVLWNFPAQAREHCRIVFRGGDYTEYSFYFEELKSPANGREIDPKPVGKLEWEADLKVNHSYRVTILQPRLSYVAEILYTDVVKVPKNRELELPSAKRIHCSADLPAFVPDGKVSPGMFLLISGACPKNAYYRSVTRTNVEGGKINFWLPVFLPGDLTIQWIDAARQVGNSLDDTLIGTGKIRVGRKNGELATEVTVTDWIARSGKPQK